MCGIVGFWDTKQHSTTEQLQATVSRMRETLVHRGPDGCGSWVDATIGIALGHRRLAIVDLTDHGSQPMQSASGRYMISFNGEIYNHLDIKAELLAAHCDPQWHGHSDTEVILAAFEAWGIEQALTRFVGMFAIALWDRQQKLLYLIRDRIGEKPLYYGWLQEYLVFGSELKSLKAHYAWQQNIDPNGVALLLQYNCIPAPYTIYQNMRKLEPGHMLIINQDRNVTDVAYWELKNVINNANNVNSFEYPKLAVDALEAKLKDAVRLQMLADVPVGAFLSGGIDSATIVALMQSQSSRPVQTFTIGFEEAGYNEAEYAKAIAAHLQTKHTELYLSAEQTQAVIPDLATFYDEPFADSSQLPTYIVSKLTRQHVTVSLSGDGGDELFAGYNRYSWVPKIWKYLAFIPKPLRPLLSKVPLNMGDKVQKLARLMNADSPYAIYQKLLTHWDNNSNKILLPDLAADLQSRSLTEIMMYMDTKRYLPDDILVKVDRAAMAVGLETRIPFLDHRVVEFAWSLPNNLKVRDGQSKWIVRQILNRYVPAALYTRPKMGFGVPIDKWLRGPLKEWAQDMLSHSMLTKHNLVDTNAVQQKLREHLAGTRNWQYHLWDVLILQSWCEAHYG